jgi:hypothetical protein
MNELSRILESHASSKQKLSLEDFVPDRRESSDDELIENRYTRITGSRESLKFLGELLIEFATGDHGCSFDLHPEGAGTVHFASGTKLGIFLVKEPCSDAAKSKE